MSGRSVELDGRRELIETLRRRIAEVEQTIVARVHAIADPGETADPEYVEGLRASVPAALRYGVARLEHDEYCPIPTELLSQARRAARNGVPLETVLRRYLAGFTLVSDYMIFKIEVSRMLGAEEFQRLLRLQAEIFDDLLDTIAAEYRHEADALARSQDERRAEYVRRLLVGELADASMLEHDLDQWHLGVVASGADARRAVRDLARGIDRRALTVAQGSDLLWAWLSGRKEFDRETVRQAVEREWGTGIVVGVGEPGRGLDGWRLTHQQAKAAFFVAGRSGRQSVAYAETALLASMLQDRLLAASLRNIYLLPLAAERDGGATLRRTLRAYFASERNASSTAAALGVTRHTVSNRLRTIEEKLGRPLAECAVDVEAALRLDEMQNDDDTVEDLPGSE